jgi:hypothetical protein
MKPSKLLTLSLLLALFIPAAAAQDLPDAPKPKPDRRVFYVGVSLLAASKTADAIETQRVQNRGGWENNPEFGRHPSSSRLAGVNALFFAGQSALFHKTESSQRWYVRWGGRAYIGLVIADHIQLATCNSKINPSSPQVHNCHEILPF